MSYIVLARKWRPKTFDEIIGQEFIKLALKNAASQGKLAHALIFSGPRGVGKTSTARIVAKALNCTGSDNKELICKDPDSACSFCTEISEGRSVDVLEIDAASNTGVDEIKRVMETVKYLPSSAKTKVYIIDEAHMLSTHAFNALLKTLEEPPGHVLFILATTEPNKIPSTIQSRCQNYNFKKLSIKEVKMQLELIAESEKITVDQETLTAISKESDGSIRDALSLMDQLIAAFGSNINYRNTVETLEILDKAHLHELLAGIIGKDPKQSIETLRNMLSRGISPRKVADNIANVLRDSLFIKIYGDKLDVDLTDDDVVYIKELTAGQSAEDLELMFSLAIENVEKVHRSPFPELCLEATVIKLATTDTTIPINKIMEKIEGLVSKLGGSSEVTTHAPAAPVKPAYSKSYSEENKSTKPNTSPSPKPTNSPAEQQINKTAEDDKEPAPAEPQKTLHPFVSFVNEEEFLLSQHLEKADSIEKDEDGIKIIFNNPTDSFNEVKSSQEELESLAYKHYKKANMNVRVELKNGSEPAKKDLSTEETAPVAQDDNGSHHDSIIEETLKIFNGKIIKQSKNKEHRS